MCRSGGQGGRLIVRGRREVIQQFRLRKILGGVFRHMPCRRSLVFLNYVLIKHLLHRISTVYVPILSLYLPSVYGGWVTRVVGDILYGCGGLDAGADAG